MKHKIEVTSATFSKLSNLTFGYDFTHGGKPYRKGHNKFYNSKGNNNGSFVKSVF